MKKTLQIGITGGIGSGKTTVCKIFEAFGIPVYYADDRAKSLMVNDIALVEGVKKLFGSEAYQTDGTLNRSFIANIVFNDKSKLAELNALVHPAVHRDGQAWYEAQQDVPYVLNDAALMVESGGYKRMDKLITVTAPKEIRIYRVVSRDDTTRKEVLSRMSKQLPEADKVKLADFVVKNDGSQSLIRQVFEINKLLRS